MEHIVTFAIGIPALNEEGNIQHLLHSLLQQKTPGLHLKKIVVFSDGSTDRTVELARAVQDPRIKVMAHQRRQGQNCVQNFLLRHSTEDIVVLLNADILPVNTDFLHRLMKPIMQNSKVGLTSADTIPLRPVTLVEKMLYASHLFKASMSHHLQDGHNVLSCRGAARAFSKQFYHQLTWPDSVPEDAYSFFLCKQLHFKFIFVPLAQVFLRLPQSLQDHVSQSHRFFLGHKRLEHYFSRSFIRKNYHIPRQALLTGFMKTFRLYPWQLAAYTIMMFGVHFLLPKQKGHASRFTAALSSKKLVS